MAEEKPSLHIDSDWKKQAQDEKKRLAEQEQQRKAAPPSPAGVVASAGASAAPAGRAQAHKAAPAQPGRRELPAANFETLVQSIVTQVLYYLGEIGARGAQPMLDLDMAKHHIDTLGVLDEKTHNNLTPEQKQMLDTALYEVRMRYISVASRYAELP